MKKLILAVVACILPLCGAHLRITFPPARQYAIDFLDNVRTSAPCGGMVYQENSDITTLQTGTPIQATWHVAYPHLGGIRFELLNVTTGEILANLTGDGYQYTNDSTAISHVLTLEESHKCDHCVLRIIRQAAEWTAAAPEGYIFWSCADVKIISNVGDDTCYSGQCLNGGACTTGTCSCPSKYEGDRCQYKNDCDDDGDCNNNGVCTDIESTYYPKKVCFCNGGKMGRYCSKDSSVSSGKKTEAELKDFYHSEFFANPQFDMYWRIMGDDKDEIEFALRVKTNTWAAIGWRPTTVTTTCRNFPSLTAAPGGNPEPEATPTPEPEASTASARRRRAAEVEMVLQRKKRETERNVIKELCEAGNVSEAIEWAQNSYRSDPSGEPQPEGEGTPAPEGEGTPAPEGEGTPEPEGEGTPEPEGETGGNNAPLHAMDCQDVIFISADDNSRHRILDSYTRDRSTPMPDSFFGGEDDLTGAAAVREDGILHAVFRRKLFSNDPTDHTLPDGSTLFIWARGQDPVRYYHWPLGGMERCKASNYDYYKINELKYHGTKDTQRGTASVNVYENPDGTDEADEGSYGYPSGCQGSACEYEAKWKYRESLGRIQFTLSASIALQKWMAIGFSDDQKMIDTDAVVVWMDDAASTPTVTDRFITARSPAGVGLDSVQNVRDFSGSYVNGRMTVEFSRDRDTKDEENDRSLATCRYFLYAWGGDVNGNDITRHTQVAASTTKICIGSGSLKVSLSSVLTWSWILCTFVISRFTL